MYWALRVPNALYGLGFSRRLSWLQSPSTDREDFPLVKDFWQCFRRSERRGALNIDTLHWDTKYTHQDQAQPWFVRWQNDPAADSDFDYSDDSDE